MEETFLDSVSRWLGYIALSWITYLIYLASGVSIADCVSAFLQQKKTEAPQIQVIPATPSTPDKTFEKFEVPPTQAQEKRTKPAPVRNDGSNSVELVLNAPNRGTTTTGNTDHPSTDNVTSECSAPETSAMMIAAAASATASAMQPNASSNLCDPMCDPATRFNVTRCSFSVEKAQTLPSIKILKPEDVCPPGTLISGLPEPGKDDHSSDTDSTSPTSTNTSDPRPTQAPFDNEHHSPTNLTDHHSPQKSNVTGTTAPVGRRRGGDDLLVRMLCDIDQVDFHHDLKEPRASIDEPLVASDAARLLGQAALKTNNPQQQTQQQKHRKTHKKLLHQRTPASEKAVRFTLPENGGDIVDCFEDSCSDEQDFIDEFHESPDSDDEDSEGSPSTQRKTSSQAQMQLHLQQSAAAPTSPSYESLLKDLSDEALDESAAHVDTECVLDALLFQTRRRRSLPTVQSPGGDYEMVYRDKLERQSLGDSAILTETNSTPTKFKASLRDEDFTDLLPPLSPDCGYDSLSEVVSSPEEFDCYGSAPQLSVIIEDPLEEDRNSVSNKRTTLTQNGNTMIAPVAADVVDGKAASLANRFIASAEDLDTDFTTVRL